MIYSLHNIFITPVVGSVGWELKKTIEYVDLVVNVSFNFVCTRVYTIHVCT